MEDTIVILSVRFKNWAQYSSSAWFIGIHFFDLIYFTLKQPSLKVVMVWLLEAKPKKLYATGAKR